MELAGTANKVMKCVKLGFVSRHVLRCCYQWVENLYRVDKPQKRKKIVEKLMIKSIRNSVIMKQQRMLKLNETEMLEKAEVKG